MKKKRNRQNDTKRNDICKIYRIEHVVSKQGPYVTKNEYGVSEELSSVLESHNFNKEKPTWFRDFYLHEYDITKYRSCFMTPRSLLKWFSINDLKLMGNENFVVSEMASRRKHIIYGKSKKQCVWDSRLHTPKLIREVNMVDFIREFSYAAS